MAIQRKIVAELETRRTGDAAAVEKTASDIDRLGDEARDAAVDVNKLESETEQLARENRELKTALSAAKKELRQFVATGKNVPRLHRAFTSLKSVIAGLGLVTVSEGLRRSVTLIADFAQQMSKVRAVSGATDEQIAALTKRARELGSTTKFSGIEAGEGMEELARAGFRADEILVAARSALELAAASAVELGSAAEIGAGTLRAFGLEADQMSRVVDVLAATSASSATSVTSLGETAKESGAIVKGAGVEFEEWAAVTGVLGDSMIRGTNAGTGLKAIVASLENVTPKAERALAKLGLTADDVSIRKHGLTTVIERLAGINEVAGASFDIFGRKGAAAISVLAGRIDRIKELREELDNSQGAARRMAEIMADNLAGSFKAFNSALQEVVLRVGDGLTPALRDATDSTTEFLRSAEGIETIGKVLGTGVIAIEVFVKAVQAGFVTISVGVEEIISGVANNVAQLLEVVSKAAEVAGFEETAQTLRSNAAFLRDVVTEFQDGVRQETVDSLRKTRDSIGKDLELLVKIWTDAGEKVKSTGGNFKQAGQDVEDAGETLDQAASQITQALERVTEAAQAGSEAAQANVAGTADAVQAELAALRDVVAEFGGIDLFELDEESLDELTAEFDRVIEIVRETGQALDPEIAAIAESLGIPVDGLVASSEKVDQVLKKILGDVRNAAKVLNEEAPALRAAIEKIGLDAIKFELSDEQRKRLRSSLQEVVDAAREMGEKIDPVIADAAANLGILIGAYERADDAVISFSGSNATLADSSVRVIETLDEEGRVVRTITQDTQSATQANREAASSAEELGQSLAEAGGRTEEAAGQIRSLGEDASASAEGLESVGTNAEQSAEKVTEAATQVEEAGERFASAADQVGEGSVALDEQAKAASQAGEQLGQTADAADQVSTAQDGLQESLSQASDAIGELDQRLESLTSKLRDVEQIKISIDVSDAKAEVTSLIALLDEASQKADKLEQVA